MLEKFSYKGVLGAPANSKDLHLSEVSVLQENIIDFKSGYAYMYDSNGIAKLSDGSNFSGVISESDRNVPAGTAVGAVSRGVRKKGVVFVALSGDTSKIFEGTYLKVASDGSFEIATDPSDAVGRANRTPEANIGVLEFNADFYKPKTNNNAVKSVKEKTNNNN